MYKRQVRNEMVDFWAVATSPVAVNKFFHTVLSGWVLGAIFVVGISCWYLLKKRNREFALASIKIGAIFGLVASLLSVWTGDGSTRCHHLLFLCEQVVSTEISCQSDRGERNTDRP